MRTLPGFPLFQWGRSLLDLCFPPLPPAHDLPAPVQRPFCERCGEQHAGQLTERYTCTNCTDRQWKLAWARAAYPMRGVVRRHLLDFKYRHAFHLLDQLTDWLEEGFLRHAAHEPWDGLVSVPLFPVRERERGYNQSQELAQLLAQRQRLAYWPCLQRIRPTGKQANLTRAGRLRNLTRAFALKSRFDVKHKRLLLIDDVFTTGATAEACARVLATGGAQHVAILTVARA